MKKLIIMSLALCGVINATGAMAGKCITAACPNEADEIGVNKEYIYSTVGGNQCYSCDSDNGAFGDNQECEYNTVIGQTNGAGETIALYQCVDATWAGDEWHSYNSGDICDNSELKADFISEIDSSHAKLIYLNKGTATSSVRSGDNFITGGGHDACRYYSCKSGYVPSLDKKSCVPAGMGACEQSYGTWKNDACECDSAKNLRLKSGANVCECTDPDQMVFDSATKGCVANPKAVNCVKSGGVWNATNQVCTCSGNKNLKSDNAGACVCKSADYDWKDAGDKAQGCEETDASKQRKNAAIIAQKKKDCESSRGKWQGGKCLCDSALFLENFGNGCKCKDGYADVSGQCQITGPEACKSVVGASWNGSVCLCNTVNFIIVGNNCVLNPAVSKCNAVSGASWVDGACICNDQNKVLNSAQTQCVESDDARQKREDAEQQAAQGAASAKINSAVNKINSMAESLKVTVWKDKDGKFNTSRLVSDSVAGVVLGTAGGLITSSVVKKNAVENGFEDIKCTVGGQTVASWGDEFQVGMR